MKIGDKVLIRTTNCVGTITDIDKEKIQVSCEDKHESRWIDQKHVELYNLKQTYRITYGDIEQYEEIQASAPIEALLIWAADNICIENVSNKKVTKLTRIEIQAYYSKYNGKFTTSEMLTSKKRYIE